MPSFVPKGAFSKPKRGVLYALLKHSFSPFPLSPKEQRNRGTVENQKDYAYVQAHVREGFPKTFCSSVTVTGFPLDSVHSSFMTFDAFDRFDTITRKLLTRTCVHVRGGFGICAVTVSSVIVLI